MVAYADVSSETRSPNLDPFFPDYLEVATAVVVSVWSTVVKLLFSYSGPSGILGSDRKQNTKLVLGGVVPLVFMNRLNRTESAVF